MLKLVLFLSLFLLNICVYAAPAIENSSLQNVTELSSTEIAIRYDGAQLWRVDFDHDVAKQSVFALQRKFDIALWNSNGSTVDVFLKKSAIDNGAADFLKQSNVGFAIVINDMQKEIDNENPPKAEIEQLQDRKARYLQLWRGHHIPKTLTKSQYSRLRGAYFGHNSFDYEMAFRPFANWGHRLTWTAYHRVADIYSFIDYMAATYPDLCSTFTIGYSVERRPLKVLKVSNKNPRNKAIWVDGGIHAREWISPASVTYFINNLVEDWDNQPDYFKSINWYIQPVVNPDGYEYTHRSDRLWRKNRSNSNLRCSGVDLNRNYGYKWGGQGTSNRPCSEIYRGAAAFSEPETAAQRDFFRSTKENFEAFLTFHSYGQYILYPWGYDTVVPPDHEDLSRVGQAGSSNMLNLNGEKYSVGPSGSLLYPAAGASDDWAKSIGIKYVYTIELRDKGRHGFVLPAYFIETTAKEAQEFIHTVTRAVTGQKRI